MSSFRPLTASAVLVGALLIPGFTSQPVYGQSSPPGRTSTIAPPPRQRLGILPESASVWPTSQHTVSPDHQYAEGVASEGFGAGRSFDVPSIDAATLLRRSISLMGTSLHQIHATGEFVATRSQPAQRARETMQGDCIMKSSSTAARYSVGGTELGSTVQKVGADFLLALSPKRSRIWSRLPGGRGRWHTDHSNTGTLGMYICPSLLSTQLLGHETIGWVNLGTTNLQGQATWHLRQAVSATRGGLKGTSLQTDIYLARSTLFWLRYVSSTVQAGTTQRASVSFSRFNVPVAITLPGS